MIRDLSCMRLRVWTVELLSLRGGARSPRRFSPRVRCVVYVCDSGHRADMTWRSATLATLASAPATAATRAAAAGDNIRTSRSDGTTTMGAPAPAPAAPRVSSSALMEEHLTCAVCLEVPVGPGRCCSPRIGCQVSKKTSVQHTLADADVASNIFRPKLPAERVEQCSNGHVLCAECLARMRMAGGVNAKCPTCSVHVPRKGSNRSLIAEQAIEVYKLGKVGHARCRYGSPRHSVHLTQDDRFHSALKNVASNIHQALGKAAVEAEERARVVAAHALSAATARADAAQARSDVAEALLATILERPLSPPPPPPPNIVTVTIKDEDESGDEGDERKEDQEGMGSL
jgi:hypothetical protein